MVSHRGWDSSSSTKPSDVRSYDPDRVIYFARTSELLRDDLRKRRVGLVVFWKQRSWQAAAIGRAGRTATHEMRWQAPRTRPKFGIGAGAHRSGLAERRRWRMLA